MAVIEKEKNKTESFKPGDKFILEIGKRQLDEFEIAGTDYYIKIYLLKKLIPYKPESCDGCKHKGKWEDELYYGISCPCINCRRRVNDNYEN